MPKKELEQELKEGTRNLLDKIGSAGEEFCVLLGAGASKAAGLPTMKELAVILEQKINNNNTVSKFLKKIIEILKSESPNGITVEQILEMIYHLHFLKEKRDEKITFKLGDLNNITAPILEDAINLIKTTIWDKCYSIESTQIENHVSFLNCFVGISGRLRKLEIYTTNWDFIIEMACDYAKYKCIDGFVGCFNAFEKFSMFDDIQNDDIKIIKLFKLHGSLNWLYDYAHKELRKKINLNKDDTHGLDKFMIYPVPSKSKEILGYPYADLINIFSNTLLKQTHPLLLTIGYSFADNHIVTKISSMLKENAHANLFIVDPTLTIKQISERIDIDVESDERITLLQTDFNMLTAMLKELS